MRFAELAKLEVVRRLLVFRVAWPFPGQTYAETGDEDMYGRRLHAWTGLQPEGVALEERYGYLPWLHPNDNNADPLVRRHVN